jgi:hypothetical protein
MLRQYEHDAEVQIESHPDRPKPGRLKHFALTYWPSILIGCLIAATWGGSYVVKILSGRSGMQTSDIDIGTPAAPLPTPKLGLSDDAAKWQLVKHLYDNYRTIATSNAIPAKVCVMHLDTEYSENAAKDFSDVLRVAGYPAVPCIRKGGGDIPKGITVWRTGESSSYANDIAGQSFMFAKMPIQTAEFSQPNVPGPLCLAADNTDIPAATIAQLNQVPA